MYSDSQHQGFSATLKACAPHTRYLTSFYPHPVQPPTSQFVMTIPTFLELGEKLPDHQEMLRRGDLHAYDPAIMADKTMFISHQCKARQNSHNKGHTQRRIVVVRSSKPPAPCTHTHTHTANRHIRTHTPQQQQKHGSHSHLSTFCSKPRCFSCSMPQGRHMNMQTSRGRSFGRSRLFSGDSKAGKSPRSRETGDTSSTPHSKRSSRQRSGKSASRACFCGSTTVLFRRW